MIIFLFLIISFTLGIRREREAHSWQMMFYYVQDTKEKKNRLNKNEKKVETHER